MFQGRSELVGADPFSLGILAFGVGNFRTPILQHPRALSVAAVSSDKPERLGSIDAVRGTAMLFVCLAHFTGIYLWRTGARELANYLGTVGMIASPTFVIVSGMMVGFLARTTSAEFANLRIKLLDRGVFLLTVGHLLLAITITRSFSNYPGTLRASFITDAIAVSIMVTPWLVSALSAKRRVAIAIGAFFLNWLAVLQWHPTISFLIVCKRYLVGIPSGFSDSDFLAFPVIPWMAVYLAATAVGGMVGRLYVSGDRKRAHVLLARMGGAALLIAATVDAITDVLRRAHVGARWNEMFFFAIYQKFPPGPVYLGFFGGAGIILLAFMLEVDRRGAFPRAMDQLRQMGRASLFTYVAQYALYVSLLGRLRLSYTPLWPVLFVFSLIILSRGAAAWDRNHGNNLLTVGISSLLRFKTARLHSGAVRVAGIRGTASIPTRI